MPTLRFPTFTIDATCGERIVGLCKGGVNSPDCPQGLYVQLPPIVNGVAREYNTYTEENKLMEAALKARASWPLLSPPSLPLECLEDLLTGFGDERLGATSCSLCDVQNA